MLNTPSLGPVAVLGVLAVDLGDVRGDGVRLGHALAARPRVPLRSGFHLHGPGLGGGVVADRHLLEEAVARELLGVGHLAAAVGPALYELHLRVEVALRGHFAALQ